MAASLQLHPKLITSKACAIGVPPCWGFGEIPLWGAPLLFLTQELIRYQVRNIRSFPKNQRIILANSVRQL